MSLLSICQDVAREVSLSTPSSIVANTGNKDAMTLLRMAQKEGFLMSRRADWQALVAEHSFTTVATDSQGSASLPSDFDRVVAETIFNRTTTREYFGPVGAQEWQQYKAGLISAINPSFRIRGGVILMSPVQTAGETVAFEYVSTKWARSEGGTAQVRFLADTDTTIWPEEVTTLGVLWRWRAHKGLEHETVRLEYERSVIELIMNDGAKVRLSMKTHSGPTVRRGRHGDYTVTA